jgi:hypothetical protein
MKYFCKYKHLLLIASFSLMLMLNSCKSSEKVSKEVKDAEKLELLQDKEANKEYEAAVKHHKKIQSKQSKKIMKDMKKSANKTNKFEQRSLWDRLFNNKCPGGN